MIGGKLGTGGRCDVKYDDDDDAHHFQLGPSEQQQHSTCFKTSSLHD